MSETKTPWTKGPLLVGPVCKGRISIHHCDDAPGAISSAVAEVIARATWRDEAIANAHLFASAPAMAEALEDMLAGWKYIRMHHGDLFGVGWDRAQSKAEAALALSRGEKPE